MELTGTASVTLQGEFIVESGASFIAQVDSGRVNVVRDYVGGIEYVNGTIEAGLKSGGNSQPVHQ